MNVVSTVRIMIAVLMTAGCMSYLHSCGEDDSAIDGLLHRERFRGVALIACGDRIVFSKGYGLASEEHQVPNTPDTVFRIGSITKQFTAIAILQLEERGLLNTDDPINKYLPVYPQGDKITLHHLLSHTAGVPDVTELPEIAVFQRKPTTVLATLEYFNSLPLEFEPGTECKYSNSGFLVLGAIVEVVSKQPYEEYLKENVFKPLELEATYYPFNEQVIPHAASGYRLANEGVLQLADFVEMTFPHGSGALASTAGDLFKLSQAYRAGKILSPSSLDRLFKIHASSQKNGIAYGYGIQVGPLNSDFEGLPPSVVGHRGNIEGFEAVTAYFAESDLSVILLSNREGTDLHFILQSLSDFLHASWRFSHRI